MKMSEMLSPEARERLLGVKAEIKPAKKAKAKKAKRAKAEPSKESLRLARAEPNEGSVALYWATEGAKASAVVVDDDRFPVTTINGVEVDLRGDALHETECVDCHEGVLVEILPARLTAEQQQELVAKPRTVRCLPCAKAYLRDKPDAKVVYRKPQVARHQPRVTDGRDHPVEVTHQKEHQMFDLSPYTDAQLTAFIKQARDLQSRRRAEAMRPNVVAAIVRRDEAMAADETLFKADRATRVGLVLPAFTCKTPTGDVEVPALDLSAVTDMSEVMSGKARSPYNKIVHRLGEDRFTSGSPDEIGKPTNLATYGAVAALHERLLKLNTTAEVVVAKVEPKVKAKAAFSKDQVKRYAKATGQSKAEARAELEAIA